MFNNFINHTLYTEYQLFNKMGCKFTVTNVYFKKENDIILNGTLWKEVENKFLPCTSPANHQKHSAAPCGPGGPFLWVYRPVPGRPRPPASLSASPAAHGVPPSGLFIVENVFICFIMKNKFAKVY